MRLFKNRQDAGEDLARLLSPKYKHLNPVILGIPRGGLEVAYYVAQQLDADLAPIISKKLPYPSHAEYGFGAITEDHTVYVIPRVKDILQPEVIEAIIAEQTVEVDRRTATYRGGQPLPDLNGRVVILVDDGIATGVTLVPLINICRNKGASMVIVASPVSSPQYDPLLNEADAVEIVVQPPDFHAVGQIYEDFSETPEERLLLLLEKADQERPDNIHPEV